MILVVLILILLVLAVHMWRATLIILSAFLIVTLIGVSIPIEQPTYVARHR